MVALIELLLGLFLGALVLLELTGKTDFLGRRKREELIERYEREGPYEPDLDGGEEGDGGEESTDDDGPRF